MRSRSLSLSLADTSFIKSVDDEQLEGVDTGVPMDVRAVCPVQPLRDLVPTLAIFIYFV